MLPTGSRPLKPPLILEGKQRIESLRHQAWPVAGRHAAGKGPALLQFCCHEVCKADDNLQGSTTREGVPIVVGWVGGPICAVSLASCADLGAGITHVRQRQNHSYHMLSWSSYLEDLCDTVAA